MRMVTYAQYALTNHKWRRKCRRLVIALVLCVAIILTSFVGAMYAYFTGSIAFTKKELAQTVAVVKVVDSPIKMPHSLQTWRKAKTMTDITDLSNSEIEMLIGEWIHNIQHRAMLKRRLVDGLTYQEIAQEFHLSVQQTKHIIYKCKDTLLKHIQI